MHHFLLYSTKSFFVPFKIVFVVLETRRQFELD